MNLPFFAVKAYVPGGVQNQAEKKFEKCLPAGTGTKIYFSSTSLRAQRLKKIKILKFSSEIEKFKRATHQTPIFVGNSERQD